jgi:hypothetical protein
VEEQELVLLSKPAAVLELVYWSELVSLMMMMMIS